MSHNVTLYDHPGPKARRRDRIYNVVFTALLLALLGWGISVAYQRGIFDERWLVLTEGRFGFSAGQVWESLARGIWGTLRAVLIAVPIVAVLAVWLTIARVSKQWFVRVPARVITEVFRGIPVLLVMYFGVLALDLTPLPAVVLGLVVYNMAVVAEILRAGIAALPSGQREAGLAIGLSPIKTLLHIEFPQAVRIMMPALISQIVVLLKDTSLGFIIAYPELLTQLKRNYNFFGEATTVPFVLTGAVLYILINIAVSSLATRIERTLSASRGASAVSGGADGDVNNAAPGKG